MNGATSFSVYVCASTSPHAQRNGRKNRDNTPSMSFLLVPIYPNRWNHSDAMGKRKRCSFSSIVEQSLTIAAASIVVVRGSKQATFLVVDCDSDDGFMLKKKKKKRVDELNSSLSSVASIIHEEEEESVSIESNRTKN